MEKSKNASGPIKPNKPFNQTSSTSDETQSKETTNQLQHTKKGYTKSPGTKENVKPFSKYMEDIPISNQDPW